MEAINSRNQVNIRGIRIMIFILQAPIVESIDRIFRNFNFRSGSGLLQFWACTPSNSEDMGCNLMLTDQTFMSTPDEGLEVYRRRCLENRYRFVGLETSVGNWLAGRSAQTRIADHWTIHHVLNHEDQHSIDIGGKGQLVLPVFFGQDAGNKLAGIIEFVTPVPKESYVEDFEQIHDLLKNEGLKSGYLGKTIKVEYNHMIKFTLPLSATFTDLHSKVTQRFTDLEHEDFRVEYNDTQGNRLPMSSDEDLRVCMAESSSKGGKFIRMYVLLNT
ncbi:putative PB1 domain-containing protein [Helianthus debilis subsp. tardiflorus]